MAATVIDGKALAAKCKREGVKGRGRSALKRPGLAVIIVGDNPASPYICQQQAEGLLPSAASTARNMPSRQRRARRS